MTIRIRTNEDAVERLRTKAGVPPHHPRLRERTRAKQLRA
jgi:hypothetical protein